MLHGDEAHQRLFGVDVELGAEAAADLGRDDAQQILRHAENAGDQGAQQVRDLGGGIQGQRFLAGAPLGDHAARLHGGRDQALAGDALLDDDFGVAECLLGVAAFLVEREGDVVGPLRMHRRARPARSLFRDRRRRAALRNRLRPGRPRRARCSGRWPPPRRPDGRRSRRGPAPAGDGAARAVRAGRRRTAPRPGSRRPRR